VVSVGLGGPHAVDDTHVTDPKLLTNDGTPTPPFDPKQNDTDPNGYGLTIILPFGATAHGGTVVLGSDNKVTYTPPAGYSGTDSFTYTISDGHGGTDQGAITVTMNSPPTAMADSETNTGATAIYSDLLNNDTDPDNADRPNFRITLPGATAIATAHGGSVSSADGLSVSYTPPLLPFYGVGTFDPRLNDSGDNVKIKSADHQSAAGGTVTVNGNSSITYVAPSAGFMGPDNFNYVIKDTYGNTATANVQVTIVSGGN
jgi:hypothetical protein